MDVLADIVRTYDIIAIQEIRDASQTALPALLDLVNVDGSQYDYVVSERLGRTTSKEQYAYIYNTHTIEVINTPPLHPGADPDGGILNLCIDIVIIFQCLVYYLSFLCFKARRLPAPTPSRAGVGAEQDGHPEQVAGGGIRTPCLQPRIMR